MDNTTVRDRWDALFRVLSSRPRRTLLIKLCEPPPDAWLRLPEAVMSGQFAGTKAELTVELQHNHLPKLAELGYLEWKADPFVATRGPHFNEVASILLAIGNQRDTLPTSLTAECDWL